MSNQMNQMEKIKLAIIGNDTEYLDGLKVLLEDKGLGVEFIVNNNINEGAIVIDKNKVHEAIIGNDTEFLEDIEDRLYSIINNRVCELIKEKETEMIEPIFNKVHEAIKIEKMKIIEEIPFIPKKEDERVRRNNLMKNFKKMRRK